MKCILGIDVGTQSVKAGLVDVSTLRMGKVASRDYPGVALQEPEVIWRATCEAIEELIGSASGVEVEAVGFSGQMHGAVLYDADGNIIGPVINWQDERANKRSDRFNGGTTVQQMTSIIGSDIFDDLGIDVMASGFMGATLFHLKEFEPEVYEKISKVLFPTDFVRMKFTGPGAYLTDVTNAFSSGVFNTRKGEWHGECIERLGLNRAIFPEVVQPGDSAGRVCAAAATMTGLREGTPVVAGGGDNQMSMVGSGVISPESPILINIGTSSQVCAVINGYKKTPGVDTRSFLKGRFILVGAGITGGICYTWLRNAILADIKELTAAERENVNVFARMDDLASRIPDGSDGLRFEPYLRGTRREPNKRAGFTGIGTDNFSMGHRARAVMEGVAEELLGFYNRFEGVAGKSVTGAGNGLVKSRLWQEIMARKFYMPVNVMDFENAVYGAALVAAEGLGIARLEDGVFDFIRTVNP